MKKKLSYLLVICFSFTGIFGYTQDTLIHLSDNDLKGIMESCEGYLRGAQSYNTTLNFLEIIGGGLLGVGLGVKQGGVAAIGFLAAT